MEIYKTNGGCSKKVKIFLINGYQLVTYINNQTIINNKPTEVQWVIIIIDINYRIRLKT